MPEISVVVPVYKVEKFLKRCVDSILAQSFYDFELILVDDGSPDSCGAMCDEYAEKDNRIKVIHKENGGLSSARNAGLDIAKGDWVTFIDSDDWIHKDYLLYLYNAAVESGKLISAAGVIDVQEYTDDNDAEYGYHFEKAADSLYIGNDFLSYACAKLYKKEIWLDFRFVNGQLMEDFYTIPEVILQETSITVLNENLYYYYRANTESITNSKRNSFKFYNDHCSGYEKNIGLFKKYKDEEHMTDLIRRYFNYNLWTYDDVKSTDDKNFKKIAKKRCYSILRKYKRYFDFKDKDFEWNLCQLSPSFRLFIRWKSLIKKCFHFCGALSRSESEE